MKQKIAGVHDLRKILEKQKYICALTGEPLTPENTTFDHIIPISKGGTSAASNLQAVTKIANRAKNSMTTKEFISLCESVLMHRKKKLP